MSKRWFQEKKQEHFYRLAKKEKYRSRASYKLKQIQEKFNVIHWGFLVVDLGASPGGWSQVASELAGSRGKVVAIDLARIRPLDGVTILRGDIRQPETVEAVIAALGGRRADCVISDMSPDISGAYSIDHARSIELAEAALEFANKCLRFKGNFVVKVFQGDMLGGYLGKVRGKFRNCRTHRPAASRPQSSETYIIAKGYGQEHDKAPPPKKGSGSEEE